MFLGTKLCISKQTIKNNNSQTKTNKQLQTNKRTNERTNENKSKTRVRAFPLETKVLITQGDFTAKSEKLGRENCIKFKINYIVKINVACSG